MFIEGLFQLTLVLATFLCSLVTGLLFVFAVVVMPGIGRLNHREFLRAFQVMDRVIQDNQPLFVFVWIGSVVALLTSTALGIGQLHGIGRLLIIFAAITYLVGAQLPTVAINIPLNNRLQTLDINRINESLQEAERQNFEPRWNRWNAVRTAFASLASGLLTILLLML